MTIRWLHFPADCRLSTTVGTITSSLLRVHFVRWRSGYIHFSRRRYINFCEWYICPYTLTGNQLFAGIWSLHVLRALLWIQDKHSVVAGIDGVQVYYRSTVNLVVNFWATEEHFNDVWSYVVRTGALLVRSDSCENSELCSQLVNSSLLNKSIYDQTRVIIVGRIFLYTPSIQWLSLATMSPWPYVTNNVGWSTW